MDEWRTILYYPLGLLPSLFFTLRFLVQWLRSERVKMSFVDGLFWKLSIAGNILLFSHYFIQGQFPFALIQAGNAVIAWRNLNLMGKAPFSFRGVVCIFLGSFVTVTFFFALFNGSEGWIRVPTTSKAVDPGILWHGIGLLGQGLFASRFWVQWWDSEGQKRSALGPAFWWLSLSGSLISLFYFLQIGDVVSILNQSFGMIPYVRNLMLLRKREIAR